MAVRRLIRHWRIAFSLAALAYLLAWGATARWGVSDIESQVVDRVCGDCPRLAIDPTYDPAAPSPKPPWCYAPPTWSPAPFLVQVDIAVMAAPTLGTRERRLFFWIGGYSRPIGFTRQIVWNS